MINARENELTIIQNFFIGGIFDQFETRYAKYLNRVRNKLQEEGFDLHSDVYNVFHISKTKHLSAPEFKKSVRNIIASAIFSLIKGLNNNDKEKVSQSARVLLNCIQGECATYLIGDASDFNGINPDKIRDHKRLKRLFEETVLSLQHLIEESYV